MLSRVADAIYWTSRYVERAENVARFVNVNLDLMLDTPTGERPSWEPLVRTTGDHEWFKEHYGDFAPDSVTKFLSFDRSYPNSILSSVLAARENARTVREVISREMWEELNALYLMVKDAARENLPAGEMARFYQQVKSAGIHFAGATDATLTHGEAWHFSRMGRMIERADKTSRIVDVKYYILLPSPTDVGTSVDQVGWTALLNSASALQMYRQQHHVISPRNVSRFLILNSQFPRAIRHCVHAMHDSLHEVTGTPRGGYESEVERVAGTLRSSLDYADIHRIMEFGLHEYLDHLQKTLNEIGQGIHSTFFDLSDERPDSSRPPSQQQTQSL